MEGPLPPLLCLGVFVVDDSSWFHLPVPCIAPLEHLHVIPSLHGVTLLYIYITALNCYSILPHKTVTVLVHCTCTIFVF